MNFIFFKKQPNTNSSKLIVWFCFFFLIVHTQSSYAFATPSQNDTIPTPVIITQIKNTIEGLFKKINKDSISPLDSVQLKFKTTSPQLLKKDSIKITKKTEHNDTIKKILKKSVKQIFWTIANKPEIVVTQTSFTNWAAGGNNTVAGILSYKCNYNYKKGQFFWTNSINLGYGLSKENGVSNPQKTEDKIEIKSDFGYNNSLGSRWSYSGGLNFKTQFAKGYNPNDKEQLKPISDFFAPATLSIGIGGTYKSSNEKFKLELSPLTNKITFVYDQVLANEGAFGVEKAVIDKTSGKIIQKGKNTYSELGPAISLEFETAVIKNINLSLVSSFYTNYLIKFGNIDSDILIKINMRVNKYISSNISSHLKYDDDTKITQNDGTKGTRLQLKQILGLGISYEF